MPQRHVSKTHSTSTLTVSRERQKPASSMVKPTCMPKTRKAAINVQTVLSGLMTEFFAGSAMSATITGCVVAGFAAGAAAAAAAGAEVAAATGAVAAGTSSAYAVPPANLGALEMR